MTQAIDCVGVVCFRDDHVLLIKRGKAPRYGQWSIPGGRIEAGESEIHAAQRELCEETSILARSFTKIETLKVDFGSGPYRLHDYAAIWVSGDPVAGDDAIEAEFVPISEIDNRIEWSETQRIIREGYEIVADILHLKSRNT